MGDHCFAEYAVGGVQNRNRVSQVAEFNLNGEHTDCYRSLFLFDDGLKAYVDLTGSVKGYAGKHTADELLFDFDGEDLEAVRKEVVNFCLYLSEGFEVPLEYPRIAFSGSKGFHVSLPVQVLGEIQPSERFHEIYGSIAHDLAAGFKSVDLSIYEPRRLMRILNTRNSKSGLYKVPLTWEELQTLSMDQIKTLAQSDRQADWLPGEEVRVVQSLRDLYEKWNAVPATIPRGEVSGENGELQSSLSGVARGNRNSAAISLVGRLIRHELPEGLILGLLRAWNTLNVPPLEDTEVVSLVRRAYLRYRQPAGDFKIYDLKQAESAYQEYASNLTKKRVLTGYPLVDNKIRGIIPGETCCILGQTSVGKSALLQNIGLSHAKASGEPVLFFSFEMPLTSVFERTVQIETGVSGTEIEAEYLKGDARPLSRFTLALANLPNFFTVVQGGLTLEGIRSFIRFAEENVYRKKTGLVLIDYLGLVKGKGDGLYEQVSAVARGMKDLAKELEVPVIFLSQINRKYANDDELQLGAARDSGAIDEASDFVLGLWRDGEGDQKTTPLVLGILKNRRGGVGKVEVTMQKRSLSIIEAALQPPQY